MMELTFYKYEGAGNDFVIIDDRKLEFPDQRTDLVKYICDRRFGIGADGLMLLRPKKDYDYNMVYYNADGNESSMCGNGGRCLAAFAHRLGIIEKKAVFTAVDGVHEAEMISDQFVRLKMTDVTEIETGEDFYYLNTGSPHFVKFMPSIDELDVFNEGRKIRYNDRFAEKGTNVNFVQEHPDHISVRTYERGVENETLACGTGIVASVICTGVRKGVNHATFSSDVQARGGKLKVSFVRKDNLISDIWLEGPAVFVFEGRIEVVI
jgi:diaminopimelate epimerase